MTQTASEIAKLTNEKISNAKINEKISIPQEFIDLIDEKFYPSPIKDCIKLD